MNRATDDIVECRLVSRVHPVQVFGEDDHECRRTSLVV